MLIFTFARGSSASRSPSPNTLSETTVMMIARPGANDSHGRVTIRVWPSAIIVPHDAVGGCTPAPRNESAVSSKMLLAMMSVKKTITELAMFGSSSMNMTRNGLAPCEIDASTNSFSRSDSTCPRSGRPMYGTRTYEMISVGIQILPLWMLMPKW